MSCAILLIGRRNRPERSAHTANTTNYDIIMKLTAFHNYVIDTRYTAAYCWTRALPTVSRGLGCMDRYKTWWVWFVCSCDTCPQEMTAQTFFEQVHARPHLIERLVPLDGRAGGGADPG